ncbi:hypothetical protein M0805_000549 [Coniferiporia weirii]|nr:hypothetical protein M0805_000549 [Coniferiporia weirii]
MTFSSLLKSFGAAFETLVLSWTSHPRLAHAASPCDYDLILEYAVSEMNFHCETFVDILFFLAVDPTYERSNLISSTLACLLLTLLAYTTLGMVSGEALHGWIEEAPHRRVLFACLVKLPALSVLGTLCALALLRWHTTFTTIVLGCVACVLVLSVVVRTRIDLLFARLGRWAGDAFAELGHVVGRVRGADQAVKEMGKSREKNECVSG